MELVAKLESFFAERQEVIAAYLFGSRAEGVAREKSDTDIAVLLSEEIKDTFAYRIEIADELERLVKTPVDLILLREAPLLLQFLIFKNGKIIFERDADQRAYYQMRVLGKYYDYQRYFDFHSNSLRKEIKERGLGLGYSRD
ncbi:MAG: type VII toxin-antitoxin system MntA family adenylyltransferase antitoxin [Bacillota bacterium]